MKKNSLLTILAALVLCFTIAFTASATGTEGTTPGEGTGSDVVTDEGTEGGTEGGTEENQPEAMPTLTITDADYTITDGSLLELPKKTLTYGGVEYTVVYSLEPAVTSTSVDSATGKTSFYGLSVEVKNYTLTAKVTVDGTELSATKAIVLKNERSAPATPVASKVTSDTIVVKSIAGAQYSISKAGSEEAAKWVTTTTLSGLEPDTVYTIIAMYPETDEYYASAKSKALTQKTKLAPAAAPKAPVLKDKTNNSIAVVAAAGYEYSIDNGKTWTTTGEFKNLTANTDYSIIARKTFDATKQDPSLNSPALKVYTNKSANTLAEISNCTVEIDYEDKLYAGQAYTFAAKGDSPSGTAVQYGDTRYVPVSFTYGGVPGQFIPDTDKDPSSRLGQFTASGENENYKIVVKFQLEEYKGNGWVAQGDPVEKEFTFDMNDTYSPVRNFFEGFINLFTHYIPLLFARMGDIFEMFFAAFMN